MNISEYAARMGVSKATIYRKIKAFGYSPKDLRGDNGELTDEALSILSAVIDETYQRNAGNAPFSQMEHVSCDVAPLRNSHDCDVSQSQRVAELEQELKETRAKLAEAEARINEMLQRSAEREQQNAEAWREALERLQRIEEQKLLAGPTPERRTIWQRLFHVADK